MKVVIIVPSGFSVMWLDELMPDIRPIIRTSSEEDWQLDNIVDLEPEFIEPTPYVGNFPPATPARKVWASALRQFYRW